jgi:hypothetical protein
MESGQRLLIPRNLLERARQVARRQSRQVQDVVVEALEQGLPLLETSVVPEQWEREIAAFHAMHATWHEHYVGEYVAVYHGELVDHDPNFGALLERIETRYPEEFVLIRPIQEEPEIVYYHRSIRWAPSDQ